MKKIKVLVFPHATNPYQKLFYNALEKKNNITITYLPDNDKKSVYVELILLPFHLIYYRLKGYKIFHLHWLYPFNLKNKYLSSIACIIYIAYIKFLGYKIVYTIHDLFPHDNIFHNNIFIAKYVFSLSDAKIALSKFTIDEAGKLNLDINNIDTIPIGNYIGVYKNNITQKEARKKLKIKERDFVFLFIGRIEPYKGVEELMKVFIQLNIRNTKLIIAGACNNIILKRKINKYKNNTIKLNLHHIPDNDMQFYLNSADVVVSPFLKVTNSSTVLLAASFGKAIIAPRIGSIKDLPDSIGYFYDNKKTLLKNSIENAIRVKKENSLKNKKALDYAKSLSWEKIAKKTYQLYKTIN